MNLGNTLVAQKPFAPPSAQWQSLHFLDSELNHASLDTPSPCEREMSTRPSLPQNTHELNP